MTTQGLANQRDLGLDSILQRLPDMIARSEDGLGHPVVVELPPTLSPAHQRLMASLGVTVRFTSESPARRAVREALDLSSLDDELADAARGWLERGDE